MIGGTEPGDRPLVWLSLTGARLLRAGAAPARFATLPHIIALGAATGTLRSHWQ